MALGVNFSEQNFVFKHPESMTEEECGDLPCHVKMEEGLPIITSCWKLTPEEIDEIIRTGVVWLSCYSLQPPVYVSGTSPFVKKEG